MNSSIKHSAPRIIICNLGTRGAGPKLTYQVAEYLDRIKLPYKVIVSTSNDQIHNFAQNFQDHIVLVDIGSKLQLLSIRKYLKFRRSLQSLTLTHEDRMIYIMPHPWDRFIRISARIYRVIHDSKRHPGDSWWPTTSSLQWRIKSGDYLICLSEYVYTSIRKLGFDSVKVLHPDFIFEKEKHAKKTSNQVVFVGRQRKYKGANLLLESWPLVLEMVPSARLLIAGQGRIPRKLKLFEGVEVHNRWLSEVEISKFLETSTVAVFPYVEASQSGLIGPAWKAGCHVVVTPVGGLIEQANRYQGFVADALTAQALADKIVEALTSPNSCRMHPKAEAEEPNLLEFIGKLLIS